jgi:3-deoxy-D-manno-octulosonic-acid transferase
MAAALALYRGLTAALGGFAPLAGRLAPAESVWRGALTGASPEAVRAAGSIWVHAASLGEVGAARNWIRALVASGIRPPMLVTARTRAGRDRARRELAGLAEARMAPADFPGLVRGLLAAASPFRLDIIETEIWPNLVMESTRAGVAVVFVSGTVSERTARRLRAIGAAGPALFGDRVYALAQSEADAARFRALGVPEGRVRVVGDVKAEEPLPEAALPPAALRPAVIFGSVRAGEEEIAVAVADALGVASAAAGPLLVAAPRHAEGLALVRRALAAAGYTLDERAEADRAATPLAGWIASAAAREGKRAAVLATHGELAEAYAHARVAVVGGTFSPHGGHNVLEPAARGCPVIVGPHHEAVAATVEALSREGAAAVARDAAEAGVTAAAWFSDGRVEERSVAALRAARSVAGASRRALEALGEWGLSP